MRGWALAECRVCGAEIIWATHDGPTRDLIPLEKQETLLPEEGGYQVEDYSRQHPRATKLAAGSFGHVRHRCGELP